MQGIWSWSTNPDTLMSGERAREIAAPCRSAPDGDGPCLKNRSGHFDSKNPAALSITVIGGS